MKSRTGGIVVAAAAALCMASAADAGSISAELQATLQTARATDQIAIIVSYRSRTDVRALAKSLREADRKLRRRTLAATLKQSGADASATLQELATAQGAVNVRLLWVANAVAMDARPALIEQLAADPAVLQVRLDEQYPAPVPAAAGAVAAQWNIEMVGAPELWRRGYSGEGVVVASLDSGVDASHPDLAPAYRGGGNSWFDPYAQHSVPQDINGHGTQVMGLIAGGDSSGSSIGVAPGARWIAARIFNDSGIATESAIHLAFQWLLDPDQDPGSDDAPDVVTNSWAISDEGVCNSVFRPDLDALRAADIAIVFSAGNYGPAPGTSVSPANDSRVISVGAVDAAGRVAGYSSRGPSACDNGVFPKFAAPGDGVFTTDLSFGGSAYYTMVTGTSFAAPHAAGALVLLRGAFPHASAPELEAALAASAHDIGAPGPDADSGYGVVDVRGAFELLGHPVDADGDGYSVDSDCNDYDPRSYPGAPEIGRDGVDQDCNGYDLTLRVRHAVYSHDGSSLRLEVTSAYGAAAAVEVDGIGPLQWRPRRRDWVLEGAGGEPRQWLTVRGPEGQISVRTRMPWPQRQ
jgi:serine protease AprX